MKVFGYYSMDDLERISTPVGESCYLCGEAFVEHDCGVTIPHTGLRGWEERPWHLACIKKQLGLKDGKPEKLP